MTEQTNTNRTPLDELKSILHRAEATNIWHPITDTSGNILAHGIGDPLDGLPPQLQSLDLRNKTVLDIGCNFGHYSFWAHRQGADHVMGIDNDILAIRGARLLQKIYGYPRLSFEVAGINQANDLPKFDMALMIDFVGKNMVQTGMLVALLDLLEGIARRQILLTIRPRYRIAKHLEGDRQGLLTRYPHRFVSNRHLYVLDYVCHRFRRNWHMSVVEQEGAPEVSCKQTVYLRRRREGA